MTRRMMLRQDICVNFVNLEIYRYGLYSLLMVPIGLERTHVSISFYFASRHFVPRIFGWVDDDKLKDVLPLFFHKPWPLLSNAFKWWPATSRIQFCLRPFYMSCCGFQLCVLRTPICQRPPVYADNRPVDVETPGGVEPRLRAHTRDWHARSYSPVAVVVERGLVVGLVLWA
jgi:hypothetical protein